MYTYQRDMKKITVFTFSHTNVSKNREMRNLSGHVGFKIVTFCRIFESESQFVKKIQRENSTRFLFQKIIFTRREREV